jgi:hypothetical protein
MAGMKMGLTVLKKKSYYALGLTLTILGIILMLLVVWRWLDGGVFSKADITSALMESFEKPDEVIGLGAISLLPYTIIGIACIVIGSVILVLRREKVTVTEEVTTLLECPLCKNQWQESMSQTYLESIGYPTVRTLSRHRCPKCAKFIRPKIVATKK